MGPQDLVAGSRLSRRHALIVGIIVLAILIAAAVGASSAGLSARTPEALWVFVLATAVAAVLSVPIVGFVVLVDRRERETPWLYGFAIGWGMLGAAGLSLALSGAGLGSVVDALADAESGAISVTGAIDLDRFITAIFLGPPIEEITKGIALVLLAIILRGQFFTLRDGIVFGLLLGIGFNLIEAPSAVMRGLAETGVAPWTPQLIGRFVFLGLNGSALYTALLGAGVGYALQRGGVRGMLGLVGGTVTSIAAHMAHNAFAGVILAVVLIVLGYDPGGATDPTAFLATIPAPTYWFGVALATVFALWWAYLLLGVLLVRGARYEQRVIRHELEDELGLSVTPDELHGVQAAGLFSLRRVPGLSGSMSRSLVDAQTKIALHRARARRHDRDPDLDPAVLAWRTEVARIRLAWRTEVARIRLAAAPPPAAPAAAPVVAKAPRKKPAKKAVVAAAPEPAPAAEPEGAPESETAKPEPETESKPAAALEPEAAPAAEPEAAPEPANDPPEPEAVTTAEPDAAQPGSESDKETPTREPVSPASEPAPSTSDPPQG